MQIACQSTNLTKTRHSEFTFGFVWQRSEYLGATKSLGGFAKSRGTCSFHSKSVGPTALIVRTHLQREMLGYRSFLHLHSELMRTDRLSSIDQARERAHFFLPVPASPIVGSMQIPSISMTMVSPLKGQLP